MKHFILIIYLGFAYSAFSQIETRPICDDVTEMPTDLTYSGFIIYDEDQNINLASNLQLRLSIVTDSINGSTIYSENNSIPTSRNGFFSVKIGENNTRNFDELMTFISENSGTAYFINAELRDQSTNQYKYIGSKELLTVPYAIVASVIGGRGATGAPSANPGMQGPEGIQGATGPQGPVGPQGVIGQDGVNGPPGFGIMKMQSTEPTGRTLYIDDGTNTSDGQPHVRYFNNGIWIDL